MRIIVLPVGWCRFLEENESGFEGTKYGGLRNVRPPIIDPLQGAILNEFEFVEKEQSTANSNSFKIAQKTAFEAEGRLYTTGKVIQRLFVIGLYIWL